MLARLVTTSTLLLSLALAVTPMALASDAESSASAYANYRCAALIQLNRMTDADTVICDVLDAPNDFDLVSWEAENPSASAELHRQVFTEFF